MPELLALLQRVLLRWNPALRVFNESFRRFILNRSDPAEIPAETKEEELNFWQRVRGSLMFAILGISLFLFITQREMWNLLIGLVPAFLHGITVLSRIPGAIKPSALGTGQNLKLS